MSLSEAAARNALKTTRWEELRDAYVKLPWVQELVDKTIEAVRSGGTLEVREPFQLFTGASGPPAQDVPKPGGTSQQALRPDSTQEHEGHQPTGVQGQSGQLTVPQTVVSKPIKRHHPK